MSDRGRVVGGRECLSREGIGRCPGSKGASGQAEFEMDDDRGKLIRYDNVRLTIVVEWAARRSVREDSRHPEHAGAHAICVFEFHFSPFDLCIVISS